MITVGPVSLEDTFSLRQAVLGWDPPRVHSDDGGSHLGVIESGTVIAVVSHASWPCPSFAGAARYFWAMAVAPSAHGRGCGRRLLSAVAAAGEAAGDQLMWADARQSAVPFYQACGFVVDDVPPYVDEVTGLVDRRVIRALAVRQS